MTQIKRYRLKEDEWRLIDNFRKHKKQDTYNENILVIGDLHCPFDLDSYLDFCLEAALKYDCTKFIQIGDVIDNHYSSYHETDPDGLSGGDELEMAISRLQRYYKAFPQMTVILGNHDRMVARQFKTAGIPKRWLRSYQEVLEVPNWEFTERLVYNNIQFIHGEGGNAAKKCKDDMMNTVSGHYHTLGYTQYFCGANFKVFGTQVGTGIDFDKYAFHYAKYGKKPIVGCAVIKDGKTPINLLMDL
jgi:hypothetical protein